MQRSNSFVAIARFGVFSIIALIVPERLWPAAGRALARLSVMTRLIKRRQLFREARAILGETVTMPEMVSVEIAKSAHAFATAFNVMGQHFSKGLDPTIRVRGTEHIDAALANGKGGILWVCPFQYAPLIAKMGLYRAGVPVSHLSRPPHGYGTSRVALAYLNRFWTDIEDRYLKERLIMAPGKEVAILRALRARLRDNGIVSITLGSEAKQTRTVPCLGGHLTVATGPLNLSLVSGAPLLPVYTVRESDGAFTVTVDRPLAIPAADDRELRFASILRELAGRLEPLISSDPSQASDWGMLTVRRPQVLPLPHEPGGGDL